MSRGRARPCGRVLVVEDDERLRDLVVEVMGGAGFTVHAVATGEEALRVAETEELDLAVLDVRLPGISGYAVCRELRERAADLPILFVSGERTESFDRVAGFLIGADDYLVKPFAPDELVERAHSLVRRLPAAARGLRAKLTAREREVLTLLADGLEQRAIAALLVISPKTVATHIEHILEKLGARSRAQAVALAYREDLLDPT